MKRFSILGRSLLLLPAVLITMFVLYEMVGLCVNHMATRQQTDRLLRNLKQEIPDLIIGDVHSETGNTSGTGNHVDCLSSVTFSSGLQKEEIITRMSAHYEWDGWSCFVEQLEDGRYLFYLNTSAPFADNLEGH